MREYICDKCGRKIIKKSAIKDKESVIKFPMSYKQEEDAEAGPARKYTEALMNNGLLAKETHDTIIRFAPSLLITKEQVDEAVGIIEGVFG